MQKNTETYKAWLVAHMPPTFKTEITDNELEIVAHTLVYSEALEEYTYLNLGSRTSIVLCLDNDRADEEILQHYGDSRLGLPVYKTYLSDAPLIPNTKNLRIAHMNFADVSGSEELLPMPEGIAEKLFKGAQTSDAVQYKLFQESGKGLLCLAWKNVQRRFFLGRLVAMFRRYKLRVTSLRFSYSKPLSTGCILQGIIGIEGANVNSAIEMSRLFREFELLKNFRGHDLLEPLVQNDVISGNQANLLRAFTSLIGQILVDVDAAMYTEENIIEAFASQVSLTVDLLKLFEAKFLPARHDIQLHNKLVAEFEAKLVSLDTGMKKNDDRRRMIFGQALNIIKHTMRTNHYEVGKLGIGFRLNPEYMNNVPGWDRKSKYPELPFGIYYVKGWNYFGFQVRFRDLARGGMRTVVSWGPEHELYERGNMFTECYNLAFTQQKKNKDIPEGGSKSIVFLSASEELAAESKLVAREERLNGASEQQIKEAVAKFEKEQRTEYMYYNQRCFLNTFLKLFIWDHEKNKLMYGENTVDYLNRPEYIYLGPDENFHDYLIDWLSKESVRLGYYPVGGAFISGKEETGVNHKEFGVTSWGVLQFLTQSLIYKGMTGKFTCKITGGPDGDVAGNMMLLLKKYYNDRASILVVTDGSGTAYDPEGFCKDALEQMFHKVQMMQDYPRECLHKGGWVLCMKNTRQPTPLTKEVLMIKNVDGKIIEEWIPFSQANKLWATEAHVVKTDVFLPCGGRPRALNMTNIQTALVDGKPTFDIVCEGANLYITPDAREFLEDKGVIIMRDSSANKCGVISSSYEILGGLCMADEDFIKVKKELAANILSRLEAVANDEAICMVEYHKKNGGKVRMTKISELVSAKINRFTDDIREYLMPIDLLKPENKFLLDVFVNYLPACIRTGHMERAMKRVPDLHKKCVIATKLACDIVYKKGLDWEPSVVEILPKLVAEFH